MKRNPQSRTYAAFAGAVLIGGANFVAVSFSNMELPPLFGAALRFGVAGALFLLLARARRVPLARGRSAAGAALYGLLGFGGAYALLYYALVGLNAGTVAVIMAAVPLFTLVIAVVLGQERLSVRGVAGGVLAVAGIGVLSAGTLGGDLGAAYLIAAVLGTVAAAASTVVAKGLPDVHPLNMNAIGMLAGTALLVVGSLVLGESWALPRESRTLLAVGWLVILGSLGLFQLFLYVVRRWSASATVYAITGMPVVAVGLGALMLGQPVTAEVVAGGALVIAAVYVGAISRARQLAKVAVTRVAPIVVLACLAAPARAQEVVDSAFRPHVVAPAFAVGSGPLVFYDEAHNNPRHDETYRPFVELLRADGFRVEPMRAPLTRETLAPARVLIMLNALASRNVDDWALPTLPALAESEVDAVLEWVSGGGALLLVADHMPFPGAVESLARRSGVVVSNGFAIDTTTWGPIVFRRSDGTLAGHPITDGRGPAERIDSVATYWGQAFRAEDAHVRALFVFGGDVVSYEPEEAWRFTPTTRAFDATGWLQAAALTRGAGRIVILGEAGMLTAQLLGPRRRPAGMNAPIGTQNQQFVLNALRWLCGLLPEAE